MYSIPTVSLFAAFNHRLNDWIANFFGFCNSNSFLLSSGHYYIYPCTNHNNIILSWFRLVALCNITQNCTQPSVIQGFQSSVEIYFHIVSLVHFCQFQLLLQNFLITNFIESVFYYKCFNSFFFRYFPPLVLNATAS